jgi:hypothetical protein
VVTFSEDEYVRERFFTHTRWVATLSDGRRVFDDEGRPGVSPPQSWLRLAAFLKENPGLRLTGLRLQFRSHHEAPLPDGAEGYFFRKAAMASPGSPTAEFWLVGHLEGGVVKVSRWRVPELVREGGDERDPGDEKLVGPSLIRNA